MNDCFGGSEAHTLSTFPSPPSSPGGDGASSSEAILRARSAGPDRSHRAGDSKDKARE